MERLLKAIVIITILIFAGCTSTDGKGQSKSDLVPEVISSYRYIPILPIPVSSSLQNGKGKALIWKNNTEALALLDNEALRASLGRRETSGLLSYGVAKGDTKFSTGLYTLDSIRYTAVPYLMPEYAAICLQGCKYKKWTSRVAFLLVGVGARAEISFSAKSSSFDAVAILTANAKNSDVSGSINLSSIGVTSASISPLLTVSPNLSTENIESTLKSLEAVKMIATFSGSSQEVMIQPQILAVDPGDIPMDALLEELYKELARGAYSNRKNDLKSHSTSFSTGNKK